MSRATMCFKGYTIYEKLLRVPDGKNGGVGSLRSTVLRNFQPVQNSWPENADEMHRGQTLLSLKNKHIRSLQKALEENGEMEGRQLSEAHIMFSKNGCEEQDLHYDYDPNVTKNLSAMPRIVLLALQRNNTTSIILYDKNIDNVIVVELHYGDCIVFDADMLHAGAASAHDNVRIHCYLDIEGVPREKGKIWPLNAKKKTEMKKKDRWTWEMFKASAYCLANITPNLVAANVVQYETRITKMLKKAQTANKTLKHHIATMKQNIDSWQQQLNDAKKKLVPLEKRKKRINDKIDQTHRLVKRVKKIREIQQKCKQLHEEEHQLMLSTANVLTNLNKT